MIDFSVVLNFVTWDISPDIITDPITIRYYGPCFIMGFLLGYPIVNRIFKHEGVDEAVLEKMLLYSMIATIVGARLGHVLLYGPYFDNGHGYFDNPITILYIHKGGLASHGGAFGLVIAMILFAKRVSKKSVYWGMDRLVIGASLAAGFIRLGNLFNSEIAGKITDSSLGWYFPRYVNTEGSKYEGWTDAALSEHLGETVLRYPTQIYEALAYFLIFGLLLWLYWKKDAGKHLGRLFGWFLILLFGVRVLVEFIKENQAELDYNFFLNKGQLFSLPFVIAGFYFLWRSYKKEQEITYESGK